MKMRLRNPRTNMFMEFYTSDEMILEEVHNDPPSCRWEDVTERCAWTYDFAPHEWQLCFRDNGRVEIVGGPMWRVRKVPVTQGRLSDQPSSVGSAFIVERIAK